MIKRIEYIQAVRGVDRRIAADKAVNERNAWHLRSIAGNGIPRSDAIGSRSYGIAGMSYAGLSVPDREITARLYADGLNAAGLQHLVTEGARALTVGDDSLGLLRLTNGAGEVYRIPAKCVEFDVDKVRRRTAEASASFHCPFAWFESDTLQRLPIIAVEGGKEYVQGSGLGRPYTFGNVANAAGGSSEYNVSVFNAGDVPAPCVIRLYGAGLSDVEIINEDTGASIRANGLPSVDGIVIDTDDNRSSAVFADGSDASAYVSLSSYISDFVLRQGANSITVRMTASSVTAAGTLIEWRGRYASCL